MKNIPPNSVYKTQKRKTAPSEVTSVTSDVTDVTNRGAVFDLECQIIPKP